MTIVKNDFVEIEFTGKANNEIFDTTNKEEAKKMGLDVDVKPVLICVGNQMLLKGFDDSIEGKEIGKKYSVHLFPENAFGKRQPSMVRPISLKIFKEKDMNPYPGMTVKLDNYIAKIISVSGGRVIVDFNNPLAGKEIDYEFTIKRKIDEEKEKVNALQDFFFRERYDFEIKDKKIIIKNKPKNDSDPFGDKKINFLIGIFKKKFNEIIGLDLELEPEKEDIAPSSKKEDIELNLKKDILETQ